MFASWKKELKAVCGERARKNTESETVVLVGL